MSLYSRLREKQSGKLATATSATVATQARTHGPTVANVATVTVVNPRKSTLEPIPALSKRVGAGDTATAFPWWLIHYTDRDPVEVACCPDATHAEILERHPDAIAAEPFTPNIRQPSAPMTACEKTAILEWLALIEETDPVIVAEVIGQCQRDADARNYFTLQAVTGRRGRDV